VDFDSDLWISTMAFGWERCVLCAQLSEIENVQNVFEVGS
jgi:hypothetical protein